MKKLSTLTIILVFIFSSNIFGKSVEISDNSEKQVFECIKSDNTSTEIKFSLIDYETETINQNDEEYHKINCVDEGGFTEVGLPALPRITRLIAIPNEGSVSIEIINIEEELLSNIYIYPYQPDYGENKTSKGTFVKDVDFYTRDEVYPKEIVEIGTPAIIRDIRVVQVTINPFQYNPQKRELRIFQNVDINITYNGKNSENIKNTDRKLSRFFEPLYRSVVINYDEIQTREEYQPGTYLFVYPDNSQVEANLQYLIDWKHLKGFEVIAASTAETGTSSSSIKNYIQNAYNTWDNPPEFICLVGDAGGSFSIPTGSYGYGEGDHYYTLLEGNDILADAFIGRLSFNTILEFQTIISKILNYEKEPYMDETAWYRSVLLVGDPSASEQSCIITNKYIKEVMRNEASYIYYEIYSSPFVTQISAAFNNGVSYFNYRGYLGMSGWGNSNTSALNNGFKLPVVVTLTCGTGDFEGTYDCISEYFLKAGSPTNPRGAIAAIGTATMSTHTCFNNCVAAGTFSGIFLDKIYNMGGSLVRGKLNLYLNYPNNPSNWVDRFSYWNNLMGDPGMEVWTNIPSELNIIYDDEVSIGSNYLDVTVSSNFGFPLEGAWVSALKGNDEIFETGFTDNNGKVFLPIDALNTGSVNLTVTKHNYIPHLGSFDIVQADYFANVLDYIIDDDNLGTSSGNGDGIINPGEDIELSVELKNYGIQTLNSVTATISSDSPWITIIDNIEDFGNILPNHSAFSFDDFDFSVDDSCLGGAEIQIDLLIEDGSGHSWKDIIYLLVQGPNLYAKEYEILDANNGILDPGETAELVVTLKNIGSVIANDISGVLSFSGEGITILDSIGYFGNILPNSEVSNNNNTFELAADTQVIPGTHISSKLHLTNPDGYDDEVDLMIEVGEVFVTDPLGPDEYGYYCYDSGDSEYDIAPIYSWIEIDPNYGGSGTVINLSDPGDTGDIEQILLEFTFMFYGKEYHMITVCSNGWIAPGTTEQYSFMNWRLPGVLGPSPMIAPFWDDLKIGGGRVCYYFNENSHYYVIEWSHLQNDYNNEEETFQLVLFDPEYYPTPTGDSEILFQYKTINNVDGGSYADVQHGQFATIGLEDQTQTVGLEYTYCNQYPTAAKHLENEMSLLFTTRGSVVLDPPIANITPSLFNFFLEPGESDNGQISIGNSGPSNLFFSIEKDYPQEDGSGGPDAFGYIWKDSDDPDGPEYKWIDISDIGIPVSFTHNDTASGPFDIGFDFSFYGETYDEFIISPNGWIGFGDDWTDYHNYNIPRTDAPRPAIFGFWDDLDPIEGGNVYYYSNEVDSLVVWFDHVIHWVGNWSGVYDFQMILTGDGKIRFEYRSVSGDIDTNTIGIQNAGGTIALQVSYEENYVHDELGVEIIRIIDWLTLEQNNGIVLPDESQDINFGIESFDLEPGEYLCNLKFSTNDPNHSLEIIPVNLFVGYLENGWIDGYVTESGIPVESAEVICGAYTLYTDVTGYFVLELLTGTYDVSSMNATIENVQVFPEQTTSINFDFDYQEFTLSSDWNWISFNRENDLTSLEIVFGELGDDIYQVKSQTQSATYYTGIGWLGDLTEISIGEAYLLQMINGSTFSLFGISIISPNNPINLSEDWNWIAYFPQDVLPLDDALLSIEDNVYQIKNQTQSATYYSGLGWLGDLTYMEPNIGYKVDMLAPDVLIYPEPIDFVLKNKIENSTDYEVISGTQYNMVLMAKVQVGDELIIGNESNSIVAFGPGGETDCRSIGKWIEGPNIWYFTIVGNENEEEISFNIFNEENDKEYECNETIIFSDNATIGNPITPYRIGNTNEFVEATKLKSNYPNPFNHSTTISFSLKEHSHVKISVYNIKGELVTTLVDEEMNPSNNHQIIWDGKSESKELANGIYFYKFETENKTFIKKMIKLH